jgi:hypothetical protein
MSVYTLVRAIYRFGDKVLLGRLPATAQARVRSVLFPLARRSFPEKITARSVGEFAVSAPSRKAASRRLPPWAEAEVAVLAQLEPELMPLVGEQASLEPYVIPWDMKYVGTRYANARRQLHGNYACFVLLGGDGSADPEVLASAPRPLAVIDLGGDETVASMARAAAADYVALPAEHLDANDHCAVLARLVLQLAPRLVCHAPHPVLDRCIERHGLALASVSELQPLVAPSRKGPG